MKLYKVIKSFVVNEKHRAWDAKVGNYFLTNDQNSWTLKTFNLHDKVVFVCNFNGQYTRLGRDIYTKEELEKIFQLKELNMISALMEFRYAIGNAGFKFIGEKQ